MIYMSSVFVADVEWAMRTWLRIQAGPSIKIWLGQPQGDPTFPMIVINGRLGGSPDLDVPLDQPRMTFDCWGPPGGGGRKQALDAMRVLVTSLTGIENTVLDADTFAYGAYDITVRWAPDATDPDNVIPRYVVDASLTLRSP
jgi:hypothetical protein